VEKNGAKGKDRGIKGVCVIIRGDLGGGRKGRSKKQKTTTGGVVRIEGNRGKENAKKDSFGRQND